MVETAGMRSCSTNWRLVCETNLKLGEHAVMVQPVLTQVVLAINEGVNLRELRLPFFTPIPFDASHLFPRERRARVQRSCIRPL